MSPEMELLIQLMRLQKAFINECGFDVEEINKKPDSYLCAYKVTRRQKKKRTAKEIKYSDDFMAAWSMYPKRAGNNSKLAAFKAFNARIQEGEPFANIMHGVQRYAKFIELTDKLNTEYVLMASTFFGPQKHYLAEWEPPKKKLNKEEREKEIQELKKKPWAKIPDSLNGLELRMFAKDFGYTLPGRMSSLDDITSYKRQLSEEINERIKEAL